MDPSKDLIDKPEVAIKSESPHQAREDYRQQHRQEYEELEGGCPRYLPIDGQGDRTTYSDRPECHTYRVEDRVLNRSARNRIIRKIGVIFESDESPFTGARPVEEGNTRRI